MATRKQTPEQARIAELEAKLAAAEKRGKTVYFNASLFNNEERTSEKQPAWRGCIRVEVVPGQPTWLNVGLFPKEANPNTENPPVFGLSLDVCRAEYAAKQEAEHKKYWANRVR